MIEICVILMTGCQMMFVVIGVVLAAKK